MTPPEQQDLVEHIEALVRGGLAPGDAARRIAQFVAGDAVQAALEEYLTLTRRVRTIREPGGATDPDLEPWYLGPTENDRFWPSYKNYLQANSWTAADIESLDGSSTKTVSLLRPPGTELISTRGILLGYVQSGKTANYTAVIAKAADAGYRLFIVLSGVTNALRNQTQDRLSREIVGLNAEDWIALTAPRRDFRDEGNVDALLGERQAAKILAVVKKNAARLRRLRTWLLSARPEILRSCPIIVIDDEADQASPNTADDDEERTAINGILVDLLRRLPKAAYIGYTATPFANFLIDPSIPEDLYPRDFILDLPRPARYFGPESIFGRDAVPADENDQTVDGLDMIRIVRPDEVANLQPASRDDRFAFRPAITPALGEALRYFWIATAARRARGQVAEHSTMLIHTSMYQEVHDRFGIPVKEYQAAILRRVQAGDQNLIEELRQQWEREQDRVPPATLGLSPVLFEQLRPHLARVLDATEIKIENARSGVRINYDEAPGRIYIVIGGNVLSRGLTLEGLSVSFFLRTASAYDTLLQTGRWFGFRRGYEDLPRIWMSDELRGFFYDLATVEKEVRLDIERYKTGHLTPIEFGVRIREHPVLAITSKLKMRHAVKAKMSFSGTTKQTTVFRHAERAWLEQNLAAAREIVARATDDGIRPQTIHDRPHLILRGVPATHILAFLEAYQIHEVHADMKPELLRGYIRAQNADGALRRWNVALVTRALDPLLGAVDLRLERPVAAINRARFMRGDLQYASIKALISEIDEAIDLEVPTAELRGLSRPELKQRRQATCPDTGLLLLYPISRHSRPDARANEQRRPLNAVEDVIGIALVFPDVEEDTPQDYMTVDLSGVRREELYPEELEEPEE